MRTSLGNLPITIDPVTGQARMVRGGVDVTRKRTASMSVWPLHGAAAGITTPLPGQETALAPSFDSQLEADRAEYLFRLQLAGEIRQYVHHPYPFPIGNDLIYTPDFMVWWADFSITIEEVKGSLKQKNARDSLTRLKVAACLYPQHQWQLLTRVRQEWRTRRMQ